jgi:hypothetical protein
VGHVRRFIRDDITQVARLHRAVFPPDAGTHREDATYHTYLRSVFLENPAGEGPLSSLVYEERDGRLTGFLGIVRRRVAIGCCRYEAAVSSQFIVDPQANVAVVAVRLLKAYLEGPQDLSIADEATDAARRIWEGLGGTTGLLHSMYWTRPLRPARLAVSFLRQRRPLRAVAAAAAPVAAGLDALIARVPGSHFRQVEPSAGAEDISTAALMAYGPKVYGDATLWVEYDDRTFQWLLDRVATKGGYVLKAAFRNELNIVGWYICHLDYAGHAEAVQIAATPAAIHGVLDHLFYHAWRHGALTVNGRMDPRFMQALSDRYCLFHRRGPWMLIKARKPELLSSFHSGNAGFSRLDGEWSLRLS